MSKKHYILSFLLFAYTILLGHNVIPHGHFDDLFSSEYHHDSRNNGNRKDNYPFSHCITLHEAIEKQTLITNHPVKRVFKKTFTNNLFCISITFKPITFLSFNEIPFCRYTKPPINEFSASSPDRAPPVLMS